MKNNPISEERGTFLDRLAVAALAAMLAFVTGLVAWAVLAGLNLGGATVVVLPFKWVLAFTLFMALLGFFRQENFLVNILQRIWRSIGWLFGFDSR